MKQKYSKGQIAKIILKTLLIGGTIVAVLALPGMAQTLKLFLPSDRKGKQKIRRSLGGLRKQRFVRIYEKDGKEIVEITESGKKKILSYQFEDMKLNQSKKWDGMWRVVIFDIPEKRKRSRDLLNYKLKEMEFYPIQKSTFISPYECKEEIEFIREHLYLGDKIKYLLVKEISEASVLKKHFNLSV